MEGVARNVGRRVKSLEGRGGCQALGVGGGMHVSEGSRIKSRYRG